MRLFHRHRTPAPATPPPPTPPAVPPAAPPPATDAVDVAAPSPGPHVRFALPAPELSRPSASPAPTASSSSPAVARLVGFFEPMRLGTEVLISELLLRYGLDPDALEKDVAQLEAVVTPLRLERSVSKIIARQGSEEILRGVATFFEDKQHQGLAEKLAELAPMLRAVLQMPPLPPAQAAQDTTKPSQSVLNLLQLLLPDCMPLPEHAPLGMLTRAIKDTLSRSERKAAAAWMSDANYQRARAMELAVDAKVTDKCMREEVLRAALEKVAPQQLATCNSILASNPNDVATQRLRARMRAISGDFEGALGDYEVVTKHEVDPSDYFARAALYTQLQRPNEALIDVERAVALDLSNEPYYHAFLRASADALTRTMDGTPGMDAADKAELLCQRGVRLLALGDRDGAQRDHQAAQALGVRAKATEALGAALAEEEPKPMPATLPTIGTGAVADDTNMAASIAKHLPWQEAIVTRAAVTLRHDFGFLDVEDTTLLRRDLATILNNGRATITEFLTQACPAEHLRPIVALLKGPQKTMLTQTVLPWVDALQLRQDLWADGLRTDEPLAVPVPTYVTPELREMVETLLPSALAATGGLHAALVDTFAADLGRTIKPEDLPTLHALLRNDAVKLLVIAYKQALAQVYAGAAGGAVVEAAKHMALRQLEAANAALKKDPNDLGALRCRAIAYSLLGEHPASLADFEALLHQEPMARNYVQRAMEFMLVGQHDRALDDANEALKLAPLSSDAYTVRSSVQLARDARDAAVQDAERGLMLALTDAQQQSAMGLMTALGGAPAEGASSDGEEAAQ